MQQIGEALGEIKNLGLSQQSLAALKMDARELSTYASTSIEGNPLSLVDVKKVLKNQAKHIRASEREVLNYNQALQRFYELVHAGKFSLSLEAVESIQGEVVAELMEHEADCGHIRRDAVVIRNPHKLDEIVFIPPDAKDVKSLMQDLLAYIDNHIDEVDPIILAGIFHRQCVIIHPFMDGNGRTTRLVTTAILGKAGFDLFEIFSFENYYNQNITQYFNMVGLQGDYYEIKDTIDFTRWLEYFAGGILDELMRTRKVLYI